MGNAIEIISIHAEGEVGDVIVGGVGPIPGATIWEQSRFIASISDFCRISKAISLR